MAKDTAWPLLTFQWEAAMTISQPVTPWMVPVSLGLTRLKLGVQAG